MILELTIRNVAIIPELTLSFGPGLSVLTGETGAGKSILLGALSLLLGERASAEDIRAGCEMATVEGLFSVENGSRLAALLDEHGLPPVEDNTLILKRELSRTGRNKNYVNGGLTPLTVLARLGEELVDLHGQHAHQSLLHRDRQRDLIDAWAGLLDLRAQVAETHGRLRASREARERLAMDEADRLRRVDLLTFQAEEISAAGVQPNEVSTLTEERNRLAHAERLLTTVQDVLEILHRREDTSVRDGLARAADGLAGLGRYDSAMGSWADDLRSAEAQIGDVVDRLADFADSFDADPSRLQAVEDRLDVLRKLQRKYGETEEAILAAGIKARAELESLTHQDEELERLAQEENQIAARLSDLAQRLSSGRTRAGELLAQRMEKELRLLGFNQAVFQVRVTPREEADGWIAWDHKRYRCGPTGADEVEFYIAPNPGEEPKPVAKTASGGELSRIMLAIKVIAASASQVPTMIFDEVDAGVGGATAEAVGRQLRQVASGRQVIVITHLSQIARFAARHYLVRKVVAAGRTSTVVEPLEGERRIEETARLLAGDRITDTARQHARELIHETE